VVSNVEGVPQLPEPVVNGVLDLALGFPKRDWNKAILEISSPNKQSGIDSILRWLIEERR